MIIKPANPILANCINISVCKLTTGWNIVNVIVPLKAERFSFFETVEKEMKKYYRVLHLRVFFRRFTKKVPKVFSSTQFLFIVRLKTFRTLSMM